MKALLLDANGKLSLGETHAPDLFPNGVRVEVKAVGINRADILQAAGHYPPPDWCWPETFSDLNIQAA